MHPTIEELIKFLEYHYPNVMPHRLTDNDSIKFKMGQVDVVQRLKRMADDNYEEMNN